MRSKCGLLSVFAVALMSVAAGSASAAPKAQTISLFETDVVFVGTGGLPTGNTPPAVGQGFVTTGTLSKLAGTKKGAPVGHIRVVCTVTSVTVTQSSGTVWTQCEVSLFLPGGVIEASGPLSIYSPTNYVPLTGGTGAYLGAQGVVKHKVVGGENSNSSIDVIDITN